MPTLREAASLAHDALSPPNGPEEQAAVDALRDAMNARLTPLYRRLANLVQARANCLAHDDIAKLEWAERHTDRLESLVREHMPSGSGFDNGTQIDLDSSTGEKLVFITAFHHMDAHGGYSGWTDHTVTVRASLMYGFDVKVSGRDRNQIKDYIGDAFHSALSLDVEEN